jgi:hypothetical protein
MHDTGNGHLHEEGAVHSFPAEGTKHIHLWAVTNMFQGDMQIFAPSDPAVVLALPLTWNVEISYRLVSDETFA